MSYAKTKGVPVYMGYNKNVTPYVLKVLERIRNGGGVAGAPSDHVCVHTMQALEFQKKTPGASTTFIHNNAYTPPELGECFERNAEGMLKNMVCDCRPKRVLGHSAFPAPIATVFTGMVGH